MEQRAECSDTETCEYPPFSQVELNVWPAQSAHEYSRLSGCDPRGDFPSFGIEPGGRWDDAEGMPTTAGRDSPDQSPDHGLGSRPLDTRVVAVTFRRTPQAPADVVYLLEVRPPGERWDESPYVAAVERILVSDGDQPPAIHTLRVTKEYSNWGAEASRADIAMSVAGTESAGGPVPAAAVEKSFRAILELAERPVQQAVQREEAIARAQLVVAALSESDVARLTLTDEEHRATSRVWSVGLVAADRTRYQVELGFVDGDPATAHVRRTHKSEVVDSLDTGNGA